MEERLSVIDATNTAFKGEILLLIHLLEQRVSALEEMQCNQETHQALNLELRKRLEKALGYKPPMGATFQVFLDEERKISEIERKVWNQFKIDFLDTTMETVRL